MIDSPEVKAVSELQRLKTFGEALVWLKAGGKAARAGWNGKGMWCVLQKGYPEGVPANKNMAEAVSVTEGTLVKVRPYLMLKTAQEDYAHWAPSGSDVIAEDWLVLA